MGSKYTKAQKDATNRYMENKHVIRIVVSKEKAAEYKRLAKTENLSLNKFILRCIEDGIKKS